MEIIKNKNNNITLGEFYECNNIINEDCDLYDEETGEIVFLFRKGVIPDDLYNIHNGIISQSKTISNNRGLASGKVSIQGLNKFQENWKPEAHPVSLVDKNGNDITEEQASSSNFFKYADGRLSKRARSNNVHSQAIGGFDKSNRFPCRLTFWTAKNINKFQTIYPLSKYISERYFEYFPDKWFNQYEIYKNSPQEFLIPESNFSTITINYDYRTACHRDAGDCKEGLTCFSIKSCGDWSGGELCFPNYDLGLNIEQGDLCIFDPHIAHCNNPLKGTGRMSFVFYLRQKMNKCENKI